MVVNQANQNSMGGGFQADPMMSSIQKSLIAETISGARKVASLNEPSRPFTPGDLPRHLFQGDDYSNRPGSSYKINNVVTQAADEFTKSHKFNSTATSGDFSQSSKAGGASTTGDVLNIMERASQQMKKPAFNSHLPVVGKPLKPMAAGASNLPIKPKPMQEAKPVPSATTSQSDKEQLSTLVSGMSEDAKLQEARNFNT